ncbi:hypothetical protein SDC9_162528 [bioreactor metagenome]|uniref:Uncharacterized protein n=1 Tax=bioreactor metagenome TaxID=1076179 RepID=A0A645FPB9_9ZZZZ
MSKAPGGRHASFMNIQNLFVTVSDVRTIMKSVVTGVPLDSVYRKAAFHADVHHDGRYYFLTNRNSGVFRALNGNNNTLQGEIVLDNAAYNIDQYSKDTFYIRKVGPLEGKFGFSPYYGTNANYMMVDFFDMGGLTIEKSTIKVRLAEINNTLKNDYQVMVIVTDTNDRALLWRASDNFVNTKENMVRISLKKNITWRDDFMNQNISDLPGISSPETQIFHEANEKDAAIILGYLGGKIPSLPWKYENPEFN